MNAGKELPSLSNQLTVSDIIMGYHLHQTQWNLMHENFILITYDEGKRQFKQSDKLSGAALQHKTHSLTCSLIEPNLHYNINI